MNKREIQIVSVIITVIIGLWFLAPKVCGEPLSDHETIASLITHLIILLIATGLLILAGYQISGGIYDFHMAKNEAKKKDALEAEDSKT